MPIPLSEVPQRAFQRLQKEGIKSLACSANLYLINLLEIPPTHIRHSYHKVRWPKSAPDHYKILWLNPEQISYMRVPSFRSSHITRGTHVSGGNWDIRFFNRDFVTIHQLKKRIKQPLLARFSKYGLYKAIRDHLCGDLEWEESEYYKYNIDIGVEKSVLLNEKEKTENLYDSIRSNGYKTQREMDNVKKEKGPPEYDEIRVNICRDGRIVLDDCRHRLAIAKILELEKIPVRVLLRHKKWQDVRQEVATVETSDRSSYRISDKVDHPDIMDVRRLRQ